jgi:CRP-like cAMP-binding protein
MTHAPNQSDPAMPANAPDSYPLIERLAAFVPLTEAEHGFLRELHANRRTIARQREVIVAGRRYDGLFILCDGIVLRYKVLSDGKRQILGLGLPGDLIGFPTCLFTDAVNSVSAVTDIVVASIPFTRLFELFRTWPRLGIALFWACAHEAAIYGEHLVNLGRRTAYQRLGHLILELHARLRAVGRAGPASYSLPLTQEVLADVLGLSGPHVNRMVRSLREEGLASIEGRAVVIHDMTGLAVLARFEDHYLAAEPIPDLT